jgi:hypothetical protein
MDMIPENRKAKCSEGMAGSSGERGSLPIIQPISRRQWLSRFAGGLGGMAFADLLLAGHETDFRSSHFAPRAKRVIFLFQSGAPSQLDLFDYKPLLNQRHGQPLPDEVRAGQRLTGMSANQAILPLSGSPFRFERHGESGTWMSELLPHTASIVDKLCLIRSMHTEAINHGPGVTHIQTGSQFPGRPCIGAWVDYGLGTENRDLPAFVVLLTKDKGGQPLGANLWGNGFLPSKHQGVLLRPGATPVVYLDNPPGVDAATRRRMLDSLGQIEALQLAASPDPLIEDKIAQYELAFRMQASIPDLADFSDEPDYVFDEYGADSRTPGTFAANCLLARRMAERGVRFVQLYHQDWDHHDNLPRSIPTQCRETDRASAALVLDLERRGMLDDTLVIWGGEFGRTNYCQGKLTVDNFGRDHHPRCFTIWMAGGGVRTGVNFGETDEFGYNIVREPVHIHDFQATILYLLGLDHERLVFKHQGRRYRLTDVEGRVVREILG